MKLIHMSVSAALLCGCTTDRIATELQDVEALAMASDAAIKQRLRPALEAERQAAITEAAQNGDTWLLSPDCENVLSLDPRTPLQDCRIDKIRFGGAPAQPGDATAALRKMSVLTAYVTALSALSDATLETDITTAYGAALAALGEFATQTESERLQAFLQERKERKEVAESVVTQAVANLRFSRLKSVVLASNDAVEELTREIQQHILNTGIAPGIDDRVARVRSAEQALLLTDTSDVAAYRAALVELEAAHADFISHYEESFVYDVGLISTAHTALAQALQSPGSTEDIAAYINALAETFDKVRELN